jgi:hypothetical protein
MWERGVDGLSDRPFERARGRIANLEPADYLHSPSVHEWPTSKANLAILDTKNPVFLWANIGEDRERETHESTLAMVYNGRDTSDAILPTQE